MPYQKLQAIETEVRNNWLANDGGLTSTAVDVLKDISWAKKTLTNLPNMFVNELRVLRDSLYEETFKASSGAEAEVLDIVRIATIEELKTR